MPDAREHAEAVLGANREGPGVPIEEVAERAKRLARDAKAVHVVFNNNNLDYAPRAAIRLRKTFGQSVPEPSPETLELF